MDNEKIAEVLGEVATLLELEGANPFRIRAYRNAIYTVEDHPRPMAEMVSAGEDLTRLDFIGKDLAASITELVNTGKLRTLEEIGERVPRTLIQVMRLPGIGPKKATRLWQGLGVVDIPSLGAAARDGRVAELDGFGEKTQARILRSLERAGHLPAAPETDGGE